jgi:hypothetical protein
MPYASCRVPDALELIEQNLRDPVLPREQNMPYALCLMPYALDLIEPDLRDAMLPGEQNRVRTPVGPLLFPL